MLLIPSAYFRRNGACPKRRFLAQKKLLRSLAESCKARWESRFAVAISLDRRGENCHRINEFDRVIEVFMYFACSVNEFWCNCGRCTSFRSPVSCIPGSLTPRNGWGGSFATCRVVALLFQSPNPAAMSQCTRTRPRQEQHKSLNLQSMSGGAASIRHGGERLPPF